MTRAVWCLLVSSAWLVGCVSGGEDSPGRDGGAGDAGGSAGSSGSAGSGGSGMGGTGGTDVPFDAGPTVALPAGCAPGDMRFPCNPVTNEGCDDTAGEACEYGIEEYFECFPPPNDVPEGGACDWELGPYCSAGHTCDLTSPESTAGVCRRNCCANTDCVAPQTCQAYDVEFGTLGVCK